MKICLKQLATLAKYAYVNMAQPLDSRTPPFYFACIESNNKFTAKQVLLLWKYIYNDCKKRDIMVATLVAMDNIPENNMKAIKVSDFLFHYFVL